VTYPRKSQTPVKSLLDSSFHYSDIIGRMRDGKEGTAASTPPPHTIRIDCVVHANTTLVEGK
jgi:hypothetical protein